MHRSNRYLAAAVCFALVAGSAAHAASWKDKLKSAVQDAQTDKTEQTTSTHANDTGNANGNQPAGANLSQQDIASGLREALRTSSDYALQELGRDGGFMNNAKVRIPLPASLDKAGKAARKLGQGEKVDAFERSMNHAAEQAVPEVADVLKNAISQISLSDARDILTGGDTALTDYFRKTAGADMADRMRPIVAKNTESVGVTRQYKTLQSSLGEGALGGGLSKLGVGAQDDLDIDNYVTDKTMDGLFTMIGEKEQAIRKNPMEQTTKLLQKVFAH